MKILLDDGAEAAITIIPGHSVVIVQPLRREGESLEGYHERVKQFMGYIPLDIFEQHRIQAIGCPYDVKWTVIPDGE